MELTTSLSRRSAPSLIMGFVGMDIGTFGRKLAMALGFGRPVDLNIDDLKIPDSALATAATELVQGCSAPFLFNHCVRTYLFGMAVALHHKLNVDAEVFYLSAIMHDLGLVPKYDGDGSFEINGARIARDFVIERELAAEKADMVHEAVALHTQVGVASKREPEIALVHFGAGVDVIGYRREDMTDRTFNTICDHAPRLHFKRDFIPLMADQAERKPNCSIAGHVGLGFLKKMAAAPFAE